MPPKRSRRKPTESEQKRLIDSRLMHISLKVDDYVYKNYPISTRSATMYMQEAHTYKNKCYGDPRTLQVIDKLVRCMKGIIEEQREMGQNETKIQTDDATYLYGVETHFMSSPVYSVTDENEMHFNQEVDINNITPSYDTEVIDTDNTIVRKIINEPKTVNHNSDLHLQKAISCLSITEDPVSLAPYTNCSQSILNDIEFIDSDNEVRKQTFTQNTENVLLPAMITKEVNKSGEAKNHNKATKDMIKNNIIPNTKKLSQINRKSPETYVEPISNVENYVHTKTNVTKEKVQKKSRKKKEMPPTKKSKIKRKGTSSVNFLETTNDENCVTKNNVTKEKVQRRPRHKKIKAIEFTENDMKESTAIKTEVHKNDKIERGKNKVASACTLNKTPNQPVFSEIQSFERGNINFTTVAVNNPAIYSKVIENDLSWMESIRYVREIATDEYIPVLLDDCFWENYTLPENWNDDDFINGIE